MQDQSIDQYYDRLLHDPNHPIASAGYHDGSVWSAVKRMLQYFAEVDMHGSSVWSHAKRAFIEALHHMETLPPDHPFWKSANLSVTWPSFLLYDYTGMPRDAQDKRSWWFRIALDLVSCPNDFSSNAWRALHALGDFQVEWAIDAARHVTMESGVGTVGSLAALITELGLIDEAQIILLQKQAFYYQGEDGCNWSWELQVLRIIQENARALRKQRARAEVAGTRHQPGVSPRRSCPVLPS
jgi:hypothetical protein